MITQCHILPNVPIFSTCTGKNILFIPLCKSGIYQPVSELFVKGWQAGDMKDYSKNWSWVEIQDNATLEGLMWNFQTISIVNQGIDPTQL